MPSVGCVLRVGDTYIAHGSVTSGLREVSIRSSPCSSCDSAVQDMENQRRSLEDALAEGTLDSCDGLHSRVFELSSVLTFGPRPNSTQAAEILKSGFKIVCLEKNGSSFADVHWPLIPLANRDFDLSEIRGLINNLKARILTGERLHLHCRGGLHRVGLVVNVLTRGLGFSADQAETFLRGPSGQSDTHREFMSHARRAFRRRVLQAANEIVGDQGGCETIRAPSDSASCEPAVEEASGESKLGCANRGRKDKDCALPHPFFDALTEKKPYIDHVDDVDSGERGAFKEAWDMDSVALTQEDLTNMELVFLDLISCTGSGLAALDNARKYTYGQWISHPRLEPFRAYMAALRPDMDLYLKGGGECTTFLDSEGQPCFNQCGTIGGPGYADRTPVGPMQELTPNQVDVIKRATGGKIDMATEAQKYVFPPKGRRAVYESLRSQSSEQKRANCVDAFQEKGITPTQLIELFASYPKYQTTLVTPSSDDASYPDITNGLVQGFVDTYLSYDPKKSAGISEMYKSGNKGAWISTAESLHELFTITVSRLLLRSVVGHELMGLMTPSQMLSLGLNDPRSLFVKAEPHSWKKKVRKAWRLIWNVSIIDQTCQSLVHVSQNKSDIQAYQDGKLTSQANGMGHDDRGVKHLGSILDDIFRDQAVVDDDASGWDLSVTRDAIYLDAERRVNRVRREPGDQVRFSVFARLIFCEAAANSSHVVVIGTYLWESQRMGITASGIPSTAGQNSPIRSMIAKLAGATAAITMGDDLIYSGKADREFMAACGIRNKGDAKTYPIGDPISFTSHLFQKDAQGEWFAEFENLPKMLARVSFCYSDGILSADDYERKRVVASALLFVTRSSSEQMDVIKRYVTLRGWNFDSSDFAPNSEGLASVGLEPDDTGLGQIYRDF